MSWRRTRADRRAFLAASGLGLRNTRARLEQLYGNAQRFTLAPSSEGGALAEVRVPYHTRADLHTSELPTVRAVGASSPPTTAAPTASPSFPPAGTRRAS